MRFHPPLFLYILVLLSCSEKTINYNFPGEPGKRVTTGLEVFIEEKAEKLRGINAVLVTNHSGTDYALRSSYSLLIDAGINITKIMAPEHGIYGYQNEYDSRIKVPGPSKNCPVYNLHHLNKRSFLRLIKDAHAVIFDIQTLSMRCYTYISNLKFLMDSMAGHPAELFVLDRPDPIGFLGPDGPLLERNHESRFIGEFPGPFMYGMTIGEAALYYSDRYEPRTRLTVIPMRGYSREMLFSETGLPWIPPSPNLPDYSGTIIYTFAVYLEGIEVSIGRGTTKPFEYIGAPYIDPELLAAGLTSMGLKNFKFRPVRFKPVFSHFRGQACGGVQVFYTGGHFSPTETAYSIISCIRKLYPQARWRRSGGVYVIDSLAGSASMRQYIDRGESAPEYSSLTGSGIRRYKRIRKKYLMY